MDSHKITSKQLWLEMLEITEEELNNVLKNKSTNYRIYKKAKPSGYRTIHCIDQKSPLYVLQNRIQKKLFNNIFLPECVHGFRANHSYVDFLIPHISNNINQRYLRLDIKDFFDSISINHIRDFFKYYTDANTDPAEVKYIIDSIIEITTYNNKFVQGALTSPAISNFAMRQIDIRISRYCQKLGVCYSRYADDLLFSSVNNYIHNKHFIIAIQSILKEYNFYINHKKTLKYDNELSLNGYVVGNGIRLSRKKFHDINKLIFDLNTNGTNGFSLKKMYQTKNKLAGYRSFLIQIDRYVTDTKYKEFIEKKISSIENIIIKLFSTI